MKRSVVLLIALALVAGVLSASSASAQEVPTEVPANPNVVDPQGDATLGLPVGPTFNGADILAAWFTHDADTISAHVQTFNDSRFDSVLFDVGFDPGVGAACMYIDAITEGMNNDTRVELYYEGDCGDQGAVPVEGGTFASGPGPEDTVINTITVPRSADPAFADGKTLATPFVTIWNNGGDQGGFGRFDTTDPGTDYAISNEPSLDPGDPPKVDPPVKKGCKKGKGQKKGCKKPKACPTFKPGELGAGAPLVKLTDGATEEAPVEQVVTLDPSTADIPLVGGDPTAAYVNIQVDPKKAKEVGLYALFEFPSRDDYDLDLLHPDGSYAARSHAFNTLIELNGTQVSSTGHGGESTASSEKLVGIKTADCGGWTLEITNYWGDGGEMPVKLWLGEIANDPQEPGAETRG